MPSGLNTENIIMATVLIPSTRQNVVAIRIFLLAAERLFGRPLLSYSSFPDAVVGPDAVVVPDAVKVVVVVLSQTVEAFCSMDLLMARSRDTPHMQTVRSVATHVPTKASAATLVAASEFLPIDRTVPARAPMHTAKRVACCPAGRSSAFDIAMISGLPRISRGSFLTKARACTSHSHT